MATTVLVILLRPFTTALLATPRIHCPVAAISGNIISAAPTVAVLLSERCDVCLCPQRPVCLSVSLSVCQFTLVLVVVIVCWCFLLSASARHLNQPTEAYRKSSKKPSICWRHVRRLLGLLETIYDIAVTPHALACCLNCQFAERNDVLKDDANGFTLCYVITALLTCRYNDVMNYEVFCLHWRIAVIDLIYYWFLYLNVLRCGKFVAYRSLILLSAGGVYAWAGLSSYIAITAKLSFAVTECKVNAIYRLSLLTGKALHSALKNNESR